MNSRKIVIKRVTSLPKDKVPEPYNPFACEAKDPPSSRTKESLYDPFNPTDSDEEGYSADKERNQTKDEPREDNTGVTGVSTTGRLKAKVTKKQESGQKVDGKEETRKILVQSFPSPPIDQKALKRDTEDDDVDISQMLDDELKSADTLNAEISKTEKVEETVREIKPIKEPILPSLPSDGTAVKMVIKRDAIDMFQLMEDEIESTNGEKINVAKKLNDDIVKEQSSTDRAESRNETSSETISKGNGVSGGSNEDSSTTKSVGATVEDIALEIDDMLDMDFDKKEFGFKDSKSFIKDKAERNKVTDAFSENSETKQEKTESLDLEDGEIIIQHKPSKLSMLDKRECVSRNEEKHSQGVEEKVEDSYEEERREYDLELAKVLDQKRKKGTSKVEARESKSHHKKGKRRRLSHDDNVAESRTSEPERRGSKIKSSSHDKRSYPEDLKSEKRDKKRSSLDDNPHSVVDNSRSDTMRKNSSHDNIVDPKSEKRDRKRKSSSYEKHDYDKERSKADKHSKRSRHEDVSEEDSRSKRHGKKRKSRDRVASDEGDFESERRDRKRRSSTHESIDKEKKLNRKSDEISRDRLSESHHKDKERKADCSSRDSVDDHRSEKRPKKSRERKISDREKSPEPRHRDRRKKSDRDSCDDEAKKDGRRTDKLGKQSKRHREKGDDFDKRDSIPESKHFSKSATGYHGQYHRVTKSSDKVMQKHRGKRSPSFDEADVDSRHVKPSSRHRSRDEHSISRSETKLSTENEELGTHKKSSRSGSNKNSEEQGKHRSDRETRKKLSPEREYEDTTLKLSKRTKHKHDRRSSSSSLVEEFNENEKKLSKHKKKKKKRRSSVKDRDSPKSNTKYDHIEMHETSHVVIDEVSTELSDTDEVTSKHRHRKNSSHGCHSVNIDSSLPDYPEIPGNSSAKSSAPVSTQEFESSFEQDVKTDRKSEEERITQPSETQLDDYVTISEESIAEESSLQETQETPVKQEIASSQPEISPRSDSRDGSKSRQSITESLSFAEEFVERSRKRWKEKKSSVTSSNESPQLCVLSDSESKTNHRIFNDATENVSQNEMETRWNGGTSSKIPGLDISSSPVNDTDFRLPLFLKPIRDITPPKEANVDIFEDSRDVATPKNTVDNEPTTSSNILRKTSDSQLSPPRPKYSPLDMVLDSENSENGKISDSKETPTLNDSVKASPRLETLPEKREVDASSKTDEQQAILNPTQILNSIGLNPQQHSAAQNAILSIAELSKHLRLDKFQDHLTSGLSRARSNTPDLIESSAVELHNKDKKRGHLKKLQFQERVAEEAKSAIKPYYESRQINKAEYKDILKKAVTKTTKSPPAPEYQPLTSTESKPNPTCPLPFSKREPRKLYTLPDLQLPPPPPPPKR